MSDRTMEILTLINTSFIALIGLVILAILCWMVRDLFWHLHDKRMQNSLRIKNSQLDAAHRNRMFSVGRDVSKL